VCERQGGRLPDEPPGERRIRGGEPSARELGGSVLAGRAGDVEWESLIPPARFTSRPATTEGTLKKLSADLGVSFEAASAKPTGESHKLRKPRIALMDT